jgi:hypothetical protein
MTYTIFVRTFISTILCTLAYMIIHELIHYFTAVILGLSAQFGLSTDSLLPSPSVKIKEHVGGIRKIAILYAPYLFNIIAILLGPIPLRLVALFTLPNIMLEDNIARNKLTVFTALAVEVVLIFLAGKSILS